MKVISIVNQKGGVGKITISGKVIIRYYSITNKSGFGWWLCYSLSIRNP